MKRISLLLIVGLIASMAFGVGTPVFDIENWIYSVMEYYQMVEEIKNTYNTVVQGAEQFEKAYKALESGDIKALTQNSQKAINKVTSASRQVDYLLDHSSDTNEILLGLKDADLKWDTADAFKDIYLDASDAYSRTKKAFKDYISETTATFSAEADQMEEDLQQTISKANSQSTTEIQSTDMLISQQAANDAKAKNQHDIITEVYKETAEEQQELANDAYGKMISQNKIQKTTEQLRELAESVKAISVEVSL